MNVPVDDTEPTMPAAAASDRIREAALRLFGEHGFDGASVRDVAAVAGVSAGLILHYFGSKEGLRAAVDEAVIDRFRTAIDDPDRIGSASVEEASATWGRAMGSVILADRDLRSYLRRCLLDGSTPGSTVFDLLLAETERGIEGRDRRGALRPDLDRRWLPYQILFVVLGPLLFEHFMQRRIDGPMFDPTMVDERSAASHDLLSRGLNPDPPTDERRSR